MSLKFNSNLSKSLIISIIMAVLLIPLSLIDSLVEERSKRHHEVSREILSKWGGPLRLRGPVLIVPYTYEDQANTSKKKYVVNEEAAILPEDLIIAGQVSVQKRTRGIYERNTFSTNLGISGHFEMPAFPDRTTSIEWDKARIVIDGLSPRELVGETSIHFQGQDYPLKMSSRPYLLAAKVSKINPDKKIPFQLSLPIRGADSLEFEPYADSMSVSLQSNWSDPSFYGATLPSSKIVNDNGFEVEWEESGTNYPEVHKFMHSKLTFQRSKYSNSTFGVKFYNSVDHYHKTERTLKYGILFVFLTFASFFLFEVICGLRLHPFQYAMVGCALVMFYLLLLSLSEHLYFWMAYSIGATSVITLIAAYCRSVLGASSRSILVASGLSVLYAYLYFLLIMEHFALMFGSFGLFAVLALIMYLTRNIDWYKEDHPNSSSQRLP